MSDLFDVWVYLSASPLLWLTLTLGAYAAADDLSRRLGRHPFANPVVVAVAVLATVLWVTETRFESYFEGAQFVHFLLGPATVALAVPLVGHARRVRATLVPMLVALLLGSATAFASAVAIAAALGASPATIASLAPKSATTPIAMGISEQLGGIPSLTAVLVIATGIIGAVAVTPLLDALRVRDYAARGFAAGLASHGIGTARAFQVNELAGTFAGIAMGLNGLMTALLAPLLAGLVPG